MKSKLYFLMLIFSSVIMLGSCTDFLEADNKSQVSASAKFKTPEGLEGLVNQAYFLLRGIHQSDDPKMFSAGTDLYTSGRSDLDQALNLYASLTPENSTIKSFFTDCYKAINAANCGLYYAPEVKSSTRDLRVQELRFLRAYWYYLLSQQFGGVPLSKNYISDATTGYPRATLSDTYSYIISELEALETSTILPAESFNGRASVRAVRALLSKVYLAAGWDLETDVVNFEEGTYTIKGTSYFAKAAAMAEKCINNGSTKLLSMSFADKWAYDKEGNGETIFAIQYSRTAAKTTDEGNSLMGTYGNYYGASNDGFKGSNSKYVSTRKSIYLFEPEDLRYAATFMTTFLGDANNLGLYYKAFGPDAATTKVWHYTPPWYECTPTNLATNFAAWRNAAPAQRSNARITTQTDSSYYFLPTGLASKRKWHSQIEQTAEWTNSVKKFDDPTGIQLKTKSFRDIVLLHLSEIYLVASEAYLMSGDNVNAVKYLNAVRKRAGFTTEINSSWSNYVFNYKKHDGVTVPVLKPIDIILDECARELYGELNRWVDLRRTKQIVKYNLWYNHELVSVNSMKGTDGEFKIYRPIPVDEINLNTAIEPEDQNPGYK